MKTTMKIALLGLCLAATNLQAFAAATITYTNVTTRTLTIALTAQVQGGTNTVLSGSLDDKQVLADLGLPTTARLLVLDHVGAVARLATATNTIDYGISTNALYGQPGNTVLNSANAKYYIERFSMALGSANRMIYAMVEGYTSENPANKSSNSKVAGAGYINESPALLQGSVQLGPETTTRFDASKYRFIPAQVN